MIEHINCFYKYAGGNAQRAVSMLTNEGFSGIPVNIKEHPQMTPQKWKRKLEKLFMEYPNFITPKDPFFTLSYTFGSKLIDKATIYSPDFEQFMLRSEPTYSFKNIVEIAKAFTGITNKEVLVVYSSNQYSLPRLLRSYVYNEKIKTNQTLPIVGEEPNLDFINNEYGHNYSNITPIREFYKL